MTTMTAYEETCFEEVKYWMRAKANAQLDWDAAEERRCQYHLNKWSDRLTAERLR